MQDFDCCIYPLEGVVKSYAWGGKHFLEDFLQKQVAKPAAEYWLGTHPSGMSIVKTEKGDVRLDEFIATDKIAVLGKEAFRYQDGLPFLFKVLDVQQMLSIQVHPSREEAEKGFAAEEARGIALDAPNRSYKDQNHKPEMLVALSDFWLLHGFLPVAEMQERLQQYSHLQPLLATFGPGHYQALYARVMQLTDAEAEQFIGPLVAEAMHKGQRNQLTHKEPLWWVAKYCMANGEKTNGSYDRGLLAILLMNIVHLQKGESLFQAAGLPHAYLEGQCVELMANSDNVLRGGLTPKFVDVAELLRHTAYVPTAPQLLAFEMRHTTEKMFETPVADFGLSHLRIGLDDTHAGLSKSVEMLLCTQGQVRIHQETAVDLQQGQAALVLAGQAYTITSAVQSEVFKAYVPR